MCGGGQAAEEKARLHNEIENMRQEKERIREQHDTLHAKLDEACTEVCDTWHEVAPTRKLVGGSSWGSDRWILCPRGWWGQATDQHDRDEKLLQQAISERDDMAAQLEALRKEVGR